MYLKGKYPSEYHRFSNQNNWFHLKQQGPLNIHPCRRLIKPAEVTLSSISSTVNNEKARELKTQRNRIFHDIANILNEDKIRELDNLASEIDKCHTRTSKCTRQLNLSTENLYKISSFVTKEVEALQNLTQSTTSLEPFIGNPISLDTPITKDEVTKRIHKLRNNRAPGYDQIPPELLMDAPTELHGLVAESLNDYFAKRKYINVGHGLPTALQKPGKPIGSTRNLRPVILLIMLPIVI